MARYKYQGTTKDQNGAVVVSMTVSVYLAGTTTAADVYAAEVGGSAVNSVTSSATTGIFTFWVDDGDYDANQDFKIVLSKTDGAVIYTSQTYDDIRVIPGNWLSGSVTWDPGSLADGAGETKQLTVTGAVLGDFVLVSAPYDLEDCVATAYVQAADTVEIRLQNESTGTRDLASGTWKVRVVK